MSASWKDIGARIRLYRESASLTQEQVAAALQIPRSAVSLLESGKREVSALELLTLADLFGVSPVVLLTGEPAGHESANPLSSRVVRYRLAAEAARTGLEVERLSKTIERQIRLTEDILASGARFPTARLPRDYRLRFHDYSYVRQGEEAAEEERLRLKLGSGPIQDIRALFEEQGILFFIRIQSDEPAFDGLSMLDGRGRPWIFVIAPNKPEWLASFRWRFTAAHEYAHLLFDFEGNEVRPIIDRDPERLAGEPTEMRANSFASAFLAPREALEGHLERLGFKKGDDLPIEVLIYLHRLYGISYSSLVWRLYNIGWIREEARAKFHEVRPQVFARAMGLDPYGEPYLQDWMSREWVVPEELVVGCLQAIREGKMTLQRAARFLGIRLEQLSMMLKEADIPATLSKADLEADLRSLIDE